MIGEESQILDSSEIQENDPQISLAERLEALEIESDTVSTYEIIKNNPILSTDGTDSEN